MLRYTKGQASIVFSGWCLELKCEGGKWMTRNQDKICERSVFLVLIEGPVDRLLLLLLLLLLL